MKPFQLSQLPGTDRRSNASFVLGEQRTAAELGFDGTLHIRKRVRRIAVAAESQSVLQKAETERVMGEPCPVEAVQVTVSDVPEAVSKSVVEVLGEDRLLPVGINLKKWFPKAALSCAVENSVGVNSSAENKAFDMAGSKTNGQLPLAIVCVLGKRWALALTFMGCCLQGNPWRPEVQLASRALHSADSAWT